MHIIYSEVLNQGKVWTKIISSDQVFQSFMFNNVIPVWHFLEPYSSIIYVHQLCLFQYWVSPCNTWQEQPNNGNKMKQGCSQENSLPAKIFIAPVTIFCKKPRAKFCLQSFPTPWMWVYQASCLQDGRQNTWLYMYTWKGNMLNKCSKQDLIPITCTLLVIVALIPGFVPFFRNKFPGLRLIFQGL